MVALVASVGGFLAGCPDSDVDLCNPNTYDDHVVPPDICEECKMYGACLDGGDASDAGDASETGDAAADAPLGQACPGQCIPGPPENWSFPEFVWMGPALQVPPCPSIAPLDAYDGHADLVATNVCGACQCNPPSGTCGLPATLTAHAATCAGTDDSTAQTPFDPPPGWDGSCTTASAVPADQACSGGPCVQSVTVAPLDMNESGCATAQLPVPKDVTTAWKTTARTCRGFPQGPCANVGEVCGPLVPPGDGFRLCVSRPGDMSCPDPGHGPYVEKHVFYDGFTDTRSCSPCNCGPPAGSTCSSEVTVYSDSACSSLPVVSVLVDAKAPMCLDVIAGSALGSKSASAPVYAPGACQPTGGEPMGSADPVNPTTFCCAPTP